MRWAVVLVASCVVGCSGGGGGGAADGGGACVALDECVIVPLGLLTATCGTAADTIETHTEDAPSVLVTSCFYRAPTALSFYFTRACYKDGATTTMTLFDQERTAPQGSTTTQEELSGLGDGAFFRYTDVDSEGALSIIKGNVLLDVFDYEGTGSGATKTCMTTIARQVLSVD